MVSFEKNMILTITSGRGNDSIRLRRFSHYYITKSYFSTTSVSIKVDKPIVVVALGVCSIYNGQSLSDSKTIKDKSKHEKIEKQSNDKGFIEIEISILNIETKKLMIQENGRILSFSNLEDPINYVYFKNPIWLAANTNYLFSIKNLNNEKYHDFYLGEVFENLKCDKKKSLLEQSLQVKCNTTGINFEFSVAYGYESDFNEICSGLVGDILFNK